GMGSDAISRFENTFFQRRPKIFSESAGCHQHTAVRVARRDVWAKTRHAAGAALHITHCAVSAACWATRRVKPLPQRSKHHIAGLASNAAAFLVGGMRFEAQGCIKGMCQMPRDGGGATGLVHYGVASERDRPGI